MTANGKLLLLFLILLLGLILCSFLGGKGCSKEGFTSDSKNITAKKFSNGTIAVKLPNNKAIVLKPTSDNNYTATGYTATIDGSGSLTVTSTSDGTVYVTTVTTNTTNTTTDPVNSSDYDDSVETDAVTSSSSSSSSAPPTNSNNSYDDYNHYNGSSSTTYYGPNGGTAKVSDVGDKGKIVVVNTNGYTKIYYIKGTSSNAKGTTATGPNDGTATIITNNGQAAIKITMPDGTLTLYTITYNGNQSVDNTINQYDTSSTTGSGSDYNNSYNGAAVTGPGGNTGAGTNYNSSDYYSSLPPGIPANQIPSGQEDLYILKSQVVPPVCPICPTPIVRSSDDPDLTKCPPCPPCSRCPEPAFDCKKVPNYNAFNPDYMPVPVISDFSGFGM